MILFNTNICASPYISWKVTMVNIHLVVHSLLFGASLVAQRVKHHLQYGRPGFNSWVGEIPWRRQWQPTPVPLPGKSHGRGILAGYKWHPTPVLLPGKSHGWRSLVGYSPWGHKELGMTERLHFFEVKYLFP